MVLIIQKTGKLILINLGVFLLLLSCTEFLLQIVGFKPGPNPNYINIQQVDSLVVYNKFYTDSMGIYKANKDWNWNDGIRINSDGFRTREFDDTARLSGQKRVMLLGDSFTWGSKAEPISKSFADRLESAGYQVFNLGIPGTDPLQYATLADMYIPILKPDIVLVSFYYGNDLMMQNRTLKPYENLYHVTNAGGINAYFNGTYIADPQEAYDLHIRKLYKKEFFDHTLEHKSRFRFFIKKMAYSSVIGTKILQLYFKVKSSLGLQYEGNSIAVKYIERIRENCSINEIEFYLFTIPFQAKIPNENYLKDLPAYHINSLSLNDYHRPPDDHFNNSGHEKYFEFMLGTIDPPAVANRE